MKYTMTKLIEMVADNLGDSELTPANYVAAVNKLKLTDPQAHSDYHSYSAARTSDETPLSVFGKEYIEARRGGLRAALAGEQYMSGDGHELDDPWTRRERAEGLAARKADEDVPWFHRAR